jgi:septal ring factor EnvC (AmiA/AmiB activator)
MQKVSVSLEDRDVEMLEDVVDDDDQEASNRSAALREVLEEYRELRERVDELEADLEAAEARSDDLRRQLREANRRDDDVDELVRYVEHERERELAREEAPIWTRGKWWLLGRDVDDDRPE